MRRRLARAAALVALSACGGTSDLPGPPEPPDEVARDAGLPGAGGEPDIDAGDDADIDAALGEDGSVPAEGGLAGADDGGIAAGDAGKDGSDAAQRLDASADARAEVDAGPDRDASAPPPPSENAPVVSASGYFSDSFGTRLLVRGSDPDGDVATFTLAFLQGGEPASFDIDGQGATSTFTGTLTSEPGETEFVLSLDLTADFAAAVDALEITIADASSNVSAPIVASKRATPTRALGESCDLLGFTRCSGSLCAPKTASQYECTQTAAARNDGCASAPVLSPPEVTSVRGTLRPHSLWDVPAGCASNDPKRRPDSVVTLRLASDAQKVTLSTRNATTTFDTQLYVLLDCPSDLPACINEQCPCADDVPADGSAMTPGSLQTVLTLHDLEAGDYQIVIDSLPTPGSTSDAWELTVSVE